MISHERVCGGFSLSHSESQKKVTENYHQKILSGVAAARRLGLVCFVELFECLSRCTEVFLLGAGTLRVSSPFCDPLIFHRSLPVAGALSALKCLSHAHTDRFLFGQILSLEYEKKEKSFTLSGSHYWG